MAVVGYDVDAMRELASAIRSKGLQIKENFMTNPVKVVESIAEESNIEAIKQVVESLKENVSPKFESAEEALALIAKTLEEKADEVERKGGR